MKMAYKTINSLGSLHEATRPLLTCRANYICAKELLVYSSMVERLTVNQKVTGSSPVRPVS